MPIADPGVKKAQKAPDPGSGSSTLVSMLRLVDESLLFRKFLKALGGATVINKGHQIKCGLCSNKLRVNIGRTIMGNIRYL
jgi:hypothetical protein